MTKEHLIAGALIAAGFYISIRAVIQFVCDKRAMQWPTTQGQISLAEIHKKWERCGTMYGYMYSPRIEYTYLIDGIEYTGDRFNQVEVSMSGDDHAKFVISQFPVGLEVEVYYNPSNPSKSMLQRAALAPGTLILMLMLGVGLLVGGLIWMNRI